MISVGRRHLGFDRILCITKIEINDTPPQNLIKIRHQKCCIVCYYINDILEIALSASWFITQTLGTAILQCLGNVYLRRQQLICFLKRRIITFTAARVLRIVRKESLFLFPF